MDNVKAMVFAKRPYVVARSYTNSSKCYWSSLGTDNKWSSWSLIGGGSVSLLTDVSVVYNSFSKVDKNVHYTTFQKPIFCHLCINLCFHNNNDIL